MQWQNFITTDGRGFATLGEAQAHVAGLLAARDPYAMCFVQPVTSLSEGVWQHEAVSEPYASRFVAAAPDAWFCVHNPLTGENLYVEGKSAASALVNDIMTAHAVHTGCTRIFQYTGEQPTDDSTAFWPYVELTT